MKSTYNCENGKNNNLIFKQNCLISIRCTECALSQKKNILDFKEVEHEYIRFFVHNIFSLSDELFTFFFPPSPLSPVVVSTCSSPTLTKTRNEIYIYMLNLLRMKIKKKNSNISIPEVTILLSQTVFSLLVSNHITKTSDAVPLLGRKQKTKLE